MGISAENNLVGMHVGICFLGVDDAEWFSQDREYEVFAVGDIVDVSKVGVGAVVTFVLLINDQGEWHWVPLESTFPLRKRHDPLSHYWPTLNTPTAKKFFEKVEQDPA